MKKLIIILCFILIISIIPNFVLSQNKIPVLSLSGKDWFFNIPDGGLEKTAYTIDTEKGKELRYIFSSLIETEKYNGVFSFPVNFDGLDYYYQDSLLNEVNINEYDFVNDTHVIKGKEIKIYREIDVVKSYALYNKSGIKVAHIYRSAMIDSKGSKIWLDMKLDSNFLYVYLNIEWLKNAVFPVILDPTFGYTTAGATAFSNANIIAGSIYSLTENGDITSISAYLVMAQYTGGKCAIYDTSLNLEATSSEIINLGTSATQWWNFTTTVSLIAGDYWLVFWGSLIGVSSRYDTGATNQWSQNAETYTTLFPDPITWDSQTNRMMSIYATYTSTGAPPTENTISITNNSPSNNSVLSSGNINFQFTPILKGTSQFMNTSLYLNSSYIKLNTTAIVNNTVNTINHILTSENATYNWFIRLYNSTNYVDSVSWIFILQIITEEGENNTISITNYSPTNSSILTSINVQFKFTPLLIGSGNFKNASLYLNSSFIKLNTTIIVNNTINTINHILTSENATYNWFIRLYNSTNYVDSETWIFYIQIITTEEIEELTVESMGILITILGLCGFILMLLILKDDDKKRQK